jgi:hypothetical protein
MKTFLSLVTLLAFLVALLATPSFAKSASGRAALKPTFHRRPSASSTDLRSIDPTVTPAFNTSDWFGAGYTPSPAGNQLWWYEYSRYERIVERELTAVARIYGFTALRTFIHNMVYDAAPAQFMDNIERYLALCHSLGIKPGFVFFDDCWDSTGATIPDSCVPVKGRHNGCWKTCPQSAQRTSVDRFHGYVTDIITRFKNDSRVLYWEIFNEPNNSNFSQTLRNAAYGWATAVKPIQPILSCWGDNPNTQIVDEHRYDQDFRGWTSDVYVNPAKGGVVTEGGSRWYQGTDADAGSVKIVMTWLYALREAYAAGKVPFVPGGIISWEVNVGNSHTRWHWGTRDGSPEPTIPWDAHIHVDQTPISYTEAGLIQAYTKGTSPFYAVSTFMPDSYTNPRDFFLSVAPSKPTKLSSDPTSDGIYEVSFWPNATVTFSLYILASDNQLPSYIINVSLPTHTLTVSRAAVNNNSLLASWDYSKMECGVITNGWNLLRVVVVGGEMDVYLNPMYTDAAGPDGIQPRVSVVDPTPLKAGMSYVGSSGGDTLVDYHSISKIDAYGEFVKMPGSSRAREQCL